MRAQLRTRGRFLSFWKQKSARNSFLSLLLLVWNNSHIDCYFLEWDNVRGKESTLLLFIIYLVFFLFFFLHRDLSANARWGCTRTQANGHPSGARGDGGWVTDDDRRLQNAEQREHRRAAVSSGGDLSPLLKGSADKNGCARGKRLAPRREVSAEAVGHCEMTMRLTAPGMTKRWVTQICVRIYSAFDGLKRLRWRKIFFLVFFFSPVTPSQEILCLVGKFQFWSWFALKLNSLKGRKCFK